jgi:hypothetical protein
MNPMLDEETETPGSPPEFPKVVKRKRKSFLQLEDGREYPIPGDPIKALGFLHHFAGKKWADRRFFFYAIMRIAEAEGWHIHPF